MPDYDAGYWPEVYGDEQKSDLEASLNEKESGVNGEVLLDRTKK